MAMPDYPLWEWEFTVKTDPEAGPDYTPGWIFQVRGYGYSDAYVKRKGYGRSDSSDTTLDAVEFFLDQFIFAFNNSDTVRRCVKDWLDKTEK